MNKISGKIIRITLIVVVFVSGYILFLINFTSPQLFLSKTQKIKANLLIVEGWLPQYAIEMAYKEFRNNNYDLIITTGINSSDLDYFMVASNGYLIFYPHIKPNLINDLEHHIIEVIAHSQMGGNYSAHFNFFINDSIVADFKADKSKREYKINWEGSLKDIDSLTIQFDNDLFDDWGDRNLLVKEIVIDNNIRIPYQYNSEFDIELLDGKDRIINNFYTNAEICRNKLITYGIDSSIVVAVPAKRVSINRTLTSVLAFQNWLKLTDINVKGINIISLGIHSRRTWIVYRKLLGESYDIGIISLPENENHESGRPKVLSMLYEIFGIAYYWIILNFIHT